MVFNGSAVFFFFHCLCHHKSRTLCTWLGHRGDGPQSLVLPIKYNIIHSTSWANIKSNPFSRQISDSARGAGFRASLVPQVWDKAKKIGMFLVVRCPSHFPGKCTDDCAPHTSPWCVSLILIRSAVQNNVLGSRWVKLRLQTGRVYTPDVHTGLSFLSDVSLHFTSTITPFSSFSLCKVHWAADHLYRSSDAAAESLKRYVSETPSDLLHIMTVLKSLEQTSADHLWPKVQDITELFKSDAKNSWQSRGKIVSLLSIFLQWKGVWIWPFFPDEPSHDFIN